MKILNVIWINIKNSLKLKKSFQIYCSFLKRQIVKEFQKRILYKNAATIRCANGPFLEAEFFLMFVVSSFTSDLQNVCLVKSGNPTQQQRRALRSKKGLNRGIYQRKLFGWYPVWIQLLHYIQITTNIFYFLVKSSLVKLETSRVHQSFPPPIVRVFYIYLHQSAGPTIVNYNSRICQFWSLWL